MTEFNSERVKTSTILNKVNTEHLNYCNGIRTHNHLVRKRTLSHSASLTSDIPPVSSKKFLDIQATTECRFTLKRECDMIRTHSQ